MREKKSADPAATLTKIIADLGALSPEERQNLLETVATFYRLRAPTQTSSQTKGTTTITHAPAPAGGGFSEARDISAKEFIKQKQPRTEVERVACLAFYLTHYESTPHFKTIDISKLNTEAAQSKMSNPHVAVENATTAGYLAIAVKGTKQISAAGEVFVQALPDRDAAKAAMANLKPRRKTHKPAKTK
jgi:hypothetical protein